jgi:KDO2-lipid IV(A) lauroyltransferase
MYNLLYGLLYLISLLPMRLLYFLSDGLYVLVYYVLGYRKKVVLNNLALAFPEKTEEERIRIAKKFYRNFLDTFMEIIRLIRADKAYVDKHFISDYAVFHQLHAQGKSWQVHLGHNFNWELASLASTANLELPMLGIYMPLGNKAFDKIFLTLRRRTGAVLLPATDMRRAMIPWRNKRYVMGLVADQSPAGPTSGYWVNFFGHPTPFVTGPEKGAIANNHPVVFASFTKIKRGYYRGEFIMGEEYPASLKKGELTARYAQYLEKTISAHPDMWLWSHRRWKWDYKPEYGPVYEPVSRDL